MRIVKVKPKGSKCSTKSQTGKAVRTLKSKTASKKAKSEASKVIRGCIKNPPVRDPETGKFLSQKAGSRKKTKPSGGGFFFFKSKSR